MEKSTTEIDNSAVAASCSGLSATVPTDNIPTEEKTTVIAENFGKKIAEQLFTMMRTPSVRPEGFTWLNFMPKLCETVRTMIADAFPHRPVEDVQGIIKEFAVLSAELHWESLLETLSPEERSVGLPSWGPESTIAPVDESTIAPVDAPPGPSTP